MKTSKILALAFAAAMLFSCNEKPVDEPDVPVGPQPQTKTLTFVLPSYGEGAGQGLKTAWQEGDQIAVHGEYAANQVIVTLSASDISNDGKSATKTVEGLYPYEREDCSSTLYAAYPAASVDNLKHCFFYNKFNSCNAQLLVAYNNAELFQFEDVCGGISFTSDETFDSYEISGLKKEIIGYEFIQVKYLESEKNFKQYLGANLSSISGKISQGTTTIFFPEEVAVDGCKIKFFKGEEVVKTCKIETPFAIERGQIVDLGNITALLKVYDNPFSADVKDLDKEGNANCYIVTEPGKYKFKAVRGNSSTDYILGVDAAAVLWETWNNDEEVVAGSVVAGASYAEDYIIFHTPETLKPGNAVIAAKDCDGKILWSWHIWVPATAIETNTYGIFSTALMDRNLGALVAAKADDSSADITSYGLMYQWGRKDPYVGVGAVGSEVNATVSGQALERANGKITLEESIANPTVLGFTAGGDWLKDADDNLWMDTEKTIYDPCPVGYKVPARDKSQVLFAGSYSSSTLGWSVNKSACIICIGSPVTTFPVAGYRDDYSPHKVAYPGGRTAIWTAHSSGGTSSAYHLNWRPNKDSYGLGETSRGRGCSVRCVAE